MDHIESPEKSDADTSAGGIQLNFLAPAQRADELGRLGPYRILKILGKGGMGLVFLAEDTKLGPNARFQHLCKLAGIRPRTKVETGVEEPWELKDIRKTCATYYDEHLPESSIEILGHSVGGITYAITLIVLR